MNNEKDQKERMFESFKKKKMDNGVIKISPQKKIMALFV